MTGPSETGKVLTMAAPKPRRGGNQRRGDRVSTTVRYPVEIHAALLAAADAAGLELSSYLVRLAAAAHNLEAPEWCQSKTQPGRRAA